jgi:Xaa-Pro aminopeptidase
VDHSLRRARLAERFEELGIDAVLVADLANVRYLTGFTGSNAQALVAARGGVLFTDGRYEEQAGREVPDLERSISREGFPSVADAVERLGIDRLGFESAVTYRFWRRLGDAVAQVGLVPLEGEVERLRAAKDREELALVGRAQAATDEAFEHVVLGGGMKEGMTERELAFALELAMREAGADEVAFETIVAFGPSGAEPHHRPSDRPLERGELVTMDLGARIEGYRSDMTRTVAFGEPDPRLLRIRDLVAAAKAAGIAAMRAGALSKDLDAAARTVIADAGLGESFPHGLGHGVGLDIHEDPFLHWSRDDAVPVGAVVTIEPGVYVPGLGGVRIEDMVEVTADGSRTITSSTDELFVG